MAINFVTNLGIPEIRYVQTSLAPTYLFDPASVGASFTVEFWVHHDSATSIQHMIDTTSLHARRGFYFRVAMFVNYVQISATVVRSANTSSPYVDIDRDDYDLLRANPIHFAITVSNGYVSGIYVNGVRRSTQVGTAVARDYAGNRLNIGHPSSYNCNFRGQELRIWNHVRTQSQIEDNMYSYVSPSSTGLDLYYKMDEMAGTDVYDSSPNERHGTVYGQDVWTEDFVTLGDRIIRGSITFHGRASASFGTPIKKAVGAIAFHGHASMLASAVKTAVGAITFRGVSTMTLVGLVLRELEDIYQISSSEIFARDQPVLPAGLANHIEVWINPLTPAVAATELYRSKEPEEIPAGGSRTFSVEYSDGPAIGVVASLAEAGLNIAITDTKYYATTAEITVKNTGATNQTCLIVVTGKPLELQGRRKIVMEDPKSVLDHGLVKYKFDSPLVQDEWSARAIGAEILRLFAVARANIEIEWRGDPALELADIVRIPEFERRGVSKKENFYIVRQELEGDRGLRASMTGRRVPEIDPLRINPFTDVLFPFLGSLVSSDGRYKPIGME